MQVRKCVIMTLLLFVLLCLLQAQAKQLGSGHSVDRNDIDTVLNFIIEKEGALYYCFGKPCEGLNSDYYYNDGDKVKITGRFKNGVPVDTIKEYYESGVLRSTYYPFRKKYKYQGCKYPYILLEQYNEAGVRIWYKNDIAGIEAHYDARGALVSELYYSRRDHCIEHYIEYFPNRKQKTVVTKRNRYDYDENGRLIRYWKRGSERFNKKNGVISGSFYFEEYDVSGAVAKIGRFYTEMKEGVPFEHLKPEFPDCIEKVPLQDYKEVKYPRLGIKEVFRWDFENKKTIIIRYRQKDNRWVEIERKSLPRL